MTGLALFFCILGLGCMVAGVYLLRRADCVGKEFVPVTATIEKIETSRTMRGGKPVTSYDVTVAYEVAGRAYRTKIDFYSSSMRQGDPIRLEYDPQNPAEVTSSDAQRFFGWVLVGCGAFVMAVGMCVPALARRFRGAASDDFPQSR